MSWASRAALRPNFSCPTTSPSAASTPRWCFDVAEGAGAALVKSFHRLGENTMKMLRNAVLLATLCAVPLPAAARDEQHLYPIWQALKSPAAQAKLAPGVRLFFGRQRHPTVARVFAARPTTTKPTALLHPD